MKLFIGEPTNRAPISAIIAEAGSHNTGRMINGHAANGQIIDRGFQSIGYSKLEPRNVIEGIFQPSSPPQCHISKFLDYLTGESILPKSGTRGRPIRNQGFCEQSHTAATPAVAISLADATGIRSK